MNKIILLLAGSDMSERQIVRYLDELSGLSRDELMLAIDRLREGPKADDRFFLASTTVPSLHQEMKVRANTSSEESFSARNKRIIGEQVSNLLRKEVGLTTYEASDLLVGALRKYLSANDWHNLPSLNKDSFVSWVQKLANFVPASVLLHEAAKIRNDKTHAYKKSDWPLDKKP
jgi:hypothetical protein